MNEIVEGCKHEFGDNILLSKPPQIKCEKCGELFILEW